ncbi:DUF554 domain-containing protein [Dolosicoccus paucivorans]|uniref:DUF554 domain-containing protein n=1 Tax=Dolosicoccus paucivorans TaxID=84521 RepID=UPI0008816F6E|nr:DUF554 domain-containing protein [Dolosicoccus paucivorans]SDI84333.1 hypothetical protein SAMN04487994_10576 [Dolosicoccus paucivorans]
MGVIVNSIAIIVGSAIGLLFKGGIPQRVHETLMNGIGLCVLYLGVDGALANENIMMLLISIGLGGFIGSWIDIDRWVIKTVNQLEARFVPKRDKNGPSLSQGFIAASMLLCIGSMVIVGSLESGLNGDHTTLYTKSVLDFVTALLLSSSLGIGVMLSSISILIVQGSLTLSAQLAAPILTPAVITDVISIGSVILIGLSLNVLEITDIKLMNLMPAIFVPVIFMLITMI